MSDFGRLIEQEVPRLRRYARALTRDIGQADDLVQSCLVRALAKEHLWQPGSNLRVWILTVLHNLHINRVRRLIREQDNAIVASACLALAQTEPSARLDLLDVERAIGKLPELQRRVILLIGLEGMRYDEAAQILAVPIGTIRSRIARARQTLRELLERDIDAAASFDRSILRRSIAGHLFETRDGATFSGLRLGQRRPPRANRELTSRARPIRERPSRRGGHGRGSRQASVRPHVRPRPTRATGP
jgi:RNA polymerase sigma-70 factor, ECF subfamily